VDGVRANNEYNSEVGRKSLSLLKLDMLKGSGVCCRAYRTRASSGNILMRLDSVGSLLTISGESGISEARKGEF